MPADPMLPILATDSNDFALMLPGDDGWAELRWQMAKRRALSLSHHGWKFFKREGPRGIYYEGFGPRQRRVMSKQLGDIRAAFLEAINHAFDVQFPSP